ncbi:MAG: hypothetical protein WCO00_03825 [Rhodospirillaceae bacterium]
MVRLMTMAAVALLVAGCATEPVAKILVPIELGAAMATLPQTKKTPTDHLMSWATGRDCSIIHYEQGGAFCEDSPKEIDRRSLYCFKTLGGVECHQRPDPYYGGERILASPPPRPLDPN